jgi:hypothetical protein
MWNGFLNIVKSPCFFSFFTLGYSGFDNNIILTEHWGMKSFNSVLSFFLLSLKSKWNYKYEWMKKWNNEIMK